VIWEGEVDTVHKIGYYGHGGDWNGRGLENILKQRTDQLLSSYGMWAVNCEVWL
jgi:hypothetical protein